MKLTISHDLYHGLNNYAFFFIVQLVLKLGEGDIWLHLPRHLQQREKVCARNR